MSKKIIGLFICVILIVAALPAVGALNVNKIEKITISGEEEWPIYGHDVSRSRYSPCSVVGGENIWEYKTKKGTWIYGTEPVVSDGKLYIVTGWRQATHQGDDIYTTNVECLDSETGEHIWISPPFGHIVDSNLAVNYGRVYVKGEYHSEEYGYSDSMCCLDTMNGNILWINPLDPHLTISRGFNVYDGKVYFSAFDDSEEVESSIYCLDAYDGTLNWKYTEIGKLSSVTEYEGKLYAVHVTKLGGLNPTIESEEKLESIGTLDDYHMSKIICLDPESGYHIWTSEGFGGDMLGPTVVNDRIYVGSKLKIYCLDVANGDMIWQRDDLGDEKSNPPAVANGKVYAAFDQYLYCLDASNGQEIWSFFDEKCYFSPPSVADGTVYIFSAGRTEGKIMSFDAETGEKKWESKMVDDNFRDSSWSWSIAVANGKLYFGAPPYNTECDWFGRIHSSVVYCFGSDGVEPKPRTVYHNTLFERLLQNFPILAKLLTLFK